MTHFFATPEETEAWLAEVVNLMGLARSDEAWPGGSHRSFLWPSGLPAPSRSPAGVLIDHPEVSGRTLTRDWIAFKPSAFSPPVALEGRRLTRRLRRSIRRIAHVPLYAVSLDGQSRDNKPSASGTATATDGNYELRTFRHQGVTFEP
jgi:hypothetical protein